MGMRSKVAIALHKDIVPLFNEFVNKNADLKEAINYVDEEIEREGHKFYYWDEISYGMVLEDIIDTFKNKVSDVYFKLAIISSAVLNGPITSPRLCSSSASLIIF